MLHAFQMYIKPIMKAVKQSNKKLNFIIPATNIIYFILCQFFNKFWN